MQNSLQKENRSGQSEPLISIITSTFRAAEHLPRAIESVRAQTFDEFEWIVIDGASTDGTVDILGRNEDVIDYWISEPDTGIYDAWNKGVRKARGKWIVFFGADDYLLAPDVLSRAAAALSSTASQYHVVYGQIIVVNQAGEEVERVGTEWARVKRKFRSLMCLPHPAVFHHRDLFQVYGNFDPAFRIAGDYEFLLRELSEHDALFVPGLVVTCMTVGGISSNPENSRKMMRETRLASRKNGQFLPGMSWVFAVLRMNFRQIAWNVLGEQRARRLLDIGRHILRKSAYWTKT
jgi:glycosyltransferase involved in cell wall biosynthesis